MKSIIILRFDKNYFYFIINLLSFIIIYRYDEMCKKQYIYELAILISILICVICLIIKKKSIVNESNSISNIESEKTETGLIVYKKNIKKNIDFEIKKGHYIIILIYIVFNIIPFLRGTKIIEIKFLRFLSNTIFLGIIFTGLFIKQNIYNHHLLSIIILLLIMFVYPDFIDSIKQKGLLLKNILCTLTYYISRGVMRKYINYIMLIEYIDPFYISIIDECSVLLKNILSYIYAYFFLSSKDANEVYFKELNLNEFNKFSFLIWFILYYISIIIYPIFDILTSYYYTPYHQCLIDILGNFLNTFIIQIENKLKNEKKEEKDNFIHNAIIAIINIFFACVLAEIIILNFCNLNKNTKIEIEKRGIAETKTNEFSTNLNITDDKDSNNISENLLYYEE